LVTFFVCCCGGGEQRSENSTSEAGWGKKNAWPRPRNGVSQICEKFLDTYPSAPRWQRTANGSAALAQQLEENAFGAEVVTLVRLNQ
jgi:hypothetical protein